MAIGPRMIVGVILLAALPVSAHFILFRPMVRDTAQLQAANQAKRDKIASFEKVTADIRDLPQEIEKLRKAIAFFENKLPEEKEMDKILGEVWQIAVKYGLNVKSVRNMTTVTGNAYSEQPIRMQINGPFVGLHQFLRAVEQLPRITQIQELMIEKEDKSEGQIKAQLTLTIYFERTRANKQI